MEAVKEKETETELTTLTSLPPQASLSLRILVIIVAIGAIYFAKVILLPILIAAFIALFASPLVGSLERMRIPKPVGSLLLVAVLIAVTAYVSALLFEPALRWLGAAPVIGERLTEGLIGVSESLGVNSKPDPVAGTTAIEEAMDSTLVKLASMFAQSTLLLAVQTVAVIIIIYFFLVYGDDLMRNVVRAQGTFSDKRMTVVMFQVIRDDISMYILWVSLINLGLGLCTAGALALIGVEDPLLWGALAAALNYAPYVGPFILTLILTAVGFSENESMFRILLAPSVFLVLNLIESQFITPTVLGRRFNINPLLVVIWMFIWGWLWGVGGMLLAIPLLMCLKLIFLHLRLIGDWVEILSGNNYHDESHSTGRKGLNVAKLTKVSTNPANKDY